MARPLRIQYEGALYHITCRGNERRNIFRNDDDRREFLSVLEKSLTICSVKLFAYVLMSNHFHLLVETPLGNFSEFVEKETGRDVEAIKKDKGDLRRLVMELLYRHGRLKGPEIGAIFGIDYSSVSQERKRLRERMTRDNKLGRLLSSFERVLLTAKIPLSLKRKKGAGYNSRPCR